MCRRLWLCLAGVILTGAVHARDFGQWETMDPEIRAWYQNLRQPDSPAASCCGEADAYFCGNLHTKTDYLGHVHNFCTIDDDRDDATLRRSHIPNGTEIEVPNGKILHEGQGNPTGHGVLFISPSGQNVYCYAMPGGV
jgi:hypothetical protein